MRLRRRSRVLSVFLVLALMALTGYTAYVGAVGSDALVDPEPDARCGTPLVQFGWDYEAINYDITDDARLMAANPDPVHCSDQGSPAGSEVVTSDGVSIAGWYIPAADGAGPTGPTIILVHGWNANKSEVLRYAVPLHDRFNVVAMDLRHGGRSGGHQITFGVQERLDVQAIVDWLERTKAPRAVGAMGNSMGGAAAAAAAVEDSRIRAIVLDSTHANALEVFGRRLSVEEGHPAIPGSWGMAGGMWLRTGHDPRSSDPLGTVPRLGDRPVLLIHGTDDAINVPANSAEQTLAAAKSAGVDIDLRYCAGGRHGDLIDHCPIEWAEWVVEFYERALG